MARPLDTAVHLRLHRDAVTALLASAAENDRSLSAEVRAAIKSHLARRVADAGNSATDTAP